MHLEFQLDTETAERCGAVGTFQIISIYDENGNDLSSKVDQGTHYYNIQEVIRDLGLEHDQVTYETEYN